MPTWPSWFERHEKAAAAIPSTSNPVKKLLLLLLLLLLLELPAAAVVVVVISVIGRRASRAVIAARQTPGCPVCRAITAEASRAVSTTDILGMGRPGGDEAVPLCQAGSVGVGWTATETRPHSDI